MSATGLTTDSLKNDCAATYVTSCAYFTLLKALTLQAATLAGASTFSVNLSVQAGDAIVLEQGGGQQERVVVSSVTGSGPYTVTPTTALTKSHASGVWLSHIPKDGTTAHEIGSITRVAASWGSPAAGVITSGNGALTVPAASGNIVGSIASFTASSSGTYKDASAVKASDYTAGGSYTPVWVETFG